MTTAFDLAPGAPGTPARWASSAKTGVGTALNPVSDVWFTLSHGIVTEVFHPFVDMACTRDLELLVTDRQEFFSEEKRDTQSQVSYLSDGVPAFRLVNTCAQGRYRLEKLVLTDPRRSTVLQQVQFVPLKGELADYSVCVLLSPHLGNQGGDNTAWVGDYKGVPMLFAQRNGLALALACSAPWRKRSAGFVGTSDGWQDRVPAQADGLELPAGRAWQRGPDRRGGPGERPAASSCSRSALVGTKGRRGIARGPACCRALRPPGKTMCGHGPIGKKPCCRWRARNSIPRICTTSAPR